MIIVKKRQTELREELDPEWVELIREAIQLGLTQEEIREYLLKDQNGIQTANLS